MNLGLYILAFFVSMLVDSIPLIGPPVWMALVFFRARYHLNIWLLLIFGVTGSALGRYIYSLYIPLLSNKVIKERVNKDVQFIGKKMEHNGWKVQLFVFVYTLVPLPSTPLFTAAGLAKIKTLRILPAFFAGKFISDAVMLNAGDYVVSNFHDIIKGILSWKTLLSIIIAILMILFFLFIDWRSVLQEKKFRLRFHIWK